MKVKTTSQFKVLEFIENNFVIDEIDIEKNDENSLKVIDKFGDSLVFAWDGNKVIVASDS